MAGIWNQLGEAEKEVFNNERNKINYIEKQYFDQNGTLPHSNVIYGDRWSHGGPEIELMRAIILRHIGGISYDLPADYQASMPHN